MQQPHLPRHLIEQFRRAALAQNSLADSQFSTCNRLASRIEKHSCGGCSARTSAALRFLYQNELIPE